MSGPTLLIWHGIAGLLHLVQSGYCVALTNTTFKNKGTFKVSNSEKTVAEYKIGNLVGVFSLLAALDHGYTFYDGDHYLQMLNKGYNTYRWWEYSISAGIMVVIIAQLSSINDIKLLGLLFGANLVLQYFGYSTEKHVSKGRLDQAQMDNAAGFVLFVSMWVPIFIAFFTAIQENDTKPPDGVYTIIFVMFVLFLVFGIMNMMYVKSTAYCKSQKASLCKFSDFRKVEIGYLILSFVAKSLLTNLTLFGGVMRPEEDQ